MIDKVEDIDCDYLELIYIAGDPDPVVDRFCKYFEYSVTDEDCINCYMRNKEDKL